MSPPASAFEREISDPIGGVDLLREAQHPTGTIVSSPDHSPTTPVRGAQAIQDRLARLQATQPLSAPATPVFRSQNHGPRALRRENAIIFSDVPSRPAVRLEHPRSDEEMPACLYVERAISPLALSGGPTFHEVNTELGTKLNNGSDVWVPTFDPQAHWTYNVLWSQVHSFRSYGGLTDKQFSIFCVQCIRCGRFMSYKSKDSHKCADLAESEDADLKMDDSEVLFWRFDDIGGHGLTMREFQYLFVRCSTCGKIMTRSSASGHDDNDDDNNDDVFR
ncbi:hypothetical protein Hypma_006363 [Hypsizygus marmoreus]|uniref:Uncharacterized protein n=1 Tax=Hypsizygus marmoreus TaxID=39966 RepID=A0A369JUB1_HYPMA|nr:hypothetical protein Hypma_006363 [Hypsizygus marmoreus]